MIEADRNQYRPRFVSPPGETLLETIQALGLSQAGLALRVGMTRKTVNEIISGAAPITPQTAIRLENTTGVPAHFWLNRERDYQESLAREAEREMLASRVKWLKKFRLTHAFKFGWLAQQADPVEQVRALLQFFGIASPDEWAAVWEKPSVTWRQSAAYTRDIYAISLWLRRGEIEAQAIQTTPFDSSRFKKALEAIRKGMSVDPKVFEPLLVENCRGTGVAVVFVPEIPGTRAYGAVKWLSPTRALIQLSLRGKTEDQLWFTFFHEAAHVLLHNKRGTILEFSNGAGGRVTKDEVEANEYAADILIPRDAWNGFHLVGVFTPARIQEFATKVRVTPGIVVGRLQHEHTIGFNSTLNRLKTKLEFASHIG
jgi:addiction module HigA family antidote